MEIHRQAKLQQLGIASLKILKYFSNFTAYDFWLMLYGGSVMDTSKNWKYYICIYAKLFNSSSV